MSYKVKRFVSAEVTEDKTNDETIEHADVDYRNGDATHYNLTVANGEIVIRSGNAYTNNPLTDEGIQRKGKRQAADEIEAAVKEIAAKVAARISVSVVLEDIGNGVYTFDANPEDLYSLRSHGKITAASDSSEESKDD